MKYFMGGTPLAAIERQMMAVPRFSPRCSSQQKAKNYRYTAEDVDCQYCEQFSHGKCTSKSCPWMLERMQAGVVRYIDMVKTCLKGNPNRRLSARITSAYADEDGIRYRSEGHRERMGVCLNNFLSAWPGNEPDPIWLATVFLLTASERIWNSCSNAVTPLAIDLRGIALTSPSTQDYAIFQMARSLLDHNQRISEYELADRTLIHDSTFTLLLDGMVLAEYGVALLPEGSEV